MSFTHETAAFGEIGFTIALAHDLRAAGLSETDRRTLKVIETHYPSLPSSRLKEVAEKLANGTWAQPEEEIGSLAVREALAS